VAGKGGGAWKVAYADFVTAMMAFFMVMWIMAQSKPVKEAVAEYFQDPLGSGSSSKTGSKGHPLGGTGLAETPNAKGSKIGSSGRKRSAGEGSRGAGLHKPSFGMLHDSNQQIEGAVIQFADDSADVDEAGKKRLARLVPEVAGKRSKIEIRGHTTRHPLPADSPFQSAWHLSYARCLAVMTALVQGGVDEERIRLSQAGVYEPLTIRPEAEQQGQNNRVEVYVLSEQVDDLVGTPKERGARFQEH